MIFIQIGRDWRRCAGLYFMKDKLEQVKNEILEKLKEVKDLKFLDDLEIKYLGRKGELTGILRSLAELGEEERRKIGRLANEIKTEVNAKFSEIRENLENKGSKSGFVDVSLPGVKLPTGHLHPITLVIDEMAEIFKELGFMVLDGPELESDFFNFEALNVPRHHPARDMQDTFYVDQKNKNGEYDLVMRTQTSPMQIRAMRKYGAPLAAIIPGRCFRSEATDVRHEHTFYQLEGIMVGEDINLSHMKGILEAVLRRLYGEDSQVRLRPKFYPFVEPGFNGEVTCYLCKGAGCRLCKKTGWLEIVGAGMVHPNVLRFGKVDPEKYSGFAFGFGLSRLVQLKYGIEDVRLFMGGDLRFLEQF